MNCEHCQPLLLDHLYGLLDGAEAAGVEAHLATCPACAAARAETARLQGLFAQAAKGSFPNTKFEPPVNTPAQPVQKAEPRTPARTTHTGSGGFGRRVAAVLPWAVAAAVLLAIPGTVVPVLDLFKNAESANRAAESARREADDATRAVADARRARENRLGDAQMSLTVAEQARVALLERWVEEQKATVQVAAARKLNIDVLKPATVQPGAPNDFLLVVRDERDGSARRSRLVAEVRASDAVLFAQPLDHEKRGNQHPIRLPASVWSKVRPDAELTLVVAEVDEKTQARTTLQEVRLAGPVFTTLLVTDKPAYRPGERLFFRSLTLDRVTLKPPAKEQVLRFDLVAGANPFARPVAGLTATGTTELVRVGDGTGRVEPVRTADGQPVRGVGCGEFVLPADLADGDYTLVLRELPAPNGPPGTLALPVTRTVKVRAAAADHYAKQVGFAAASFVSGDTVEAWTELKFHDRPVTGAEVASAVVQVDGVPLHGIEATPQTDKDGRARVRFALPRDVLNGDVRLKVTFRAGNREETVADRVPVISRRLKVEFFPEGGDQIVAGVPCKVYVRATTPAGQPVDISGTVTDGRQTLATVKTLRDDAERGANRGLAAFTYTPQAGTPVWLKLDAPHGVQAPILVDAPLRVSAVAMLGGPAAVAQQTGFALPDAQLDGVVMSVPDVVTAPGQPIGVHLYSVGQPRTLVVGAYVRGRLADTQKVRAEPGQLTEVKLMAGADPRGGVVRVTVFEEVDARNDPERTDLKPVAERLVFRRAGEVLNLALNVATTETETLAAAAPRALGRAAYKPGTPLSCAVSATDEKNNPAAAVLWAAVVNTGVAPGAKDRTLPTHFLLAGDVKEPDELEYADFLLTDHPKAREALDLVLGTQGWRRFAEQARLPLAGGRQFTGANYGYPNLSAGPELTRLMVQNGQYAVAAEPAAVRDARKIGETYSPLYEAAVQAVARAQAALDATRTKARDGTEVQQAQEAESAARRSAAEQMARAESARAPVQRFRSAVWFGVAGFAALALLCGGVSLARPQARLPLGVSTVGSFGLAAFLFVASGWADEARGHDPVARAAPGVREGAKAPTEIAPPPRLVRGHTDRDAAPAAGAALAPNGVPEVKPDGVAKVPLGGVGGGAGGFGGAGGPAGPIGRVPPGPAAPPVPGVSSGAKMGFAPAAGAPGAPVVPLAPPAYDLKSSAAPAPAGVTDAHGETGWVPVRPLGVTASDLRRNAPSDPYFWSSALKLVGDDRAAALRKANADAAKFAQERQRNLAAQVEAHYGNRGAAKGAPAPRAAPELPPVPPVALSDALTPAKVEALALQQVREAVSPLPPLVVREYAHPRPAPAPLTGAADAPDTILWQPVIVVPGDGKAVLNFALGTAPGGYRVVVAGHTADGRLGEARALVAVAPAPTTLPPAQTATGGSVPPKVPTAPAPPPGP